MSAPRQPLSAIDRLKKLRAMSAGELWTRVRYDAYCQMERRRHARGGLSSRGDLRTALTAQLAGTRDWRVALLDSRRQRPRFFAGVENLQATRTLLNARYPAAHALARCHAERAVRHEFSFFGGVYAYPERVEWHADPVTRAPWPRVYHRDVPVHGGNVGYGDVKHVWELGRHQFLIDLAKGWALDRDPRYSTAMRALVHDWRAENPVGTGVAWSCALEPAFRAWSWLWAYFLTLDDPGFGQDEHVAWLEGFHDHGWFLYRHLEYYSSPYNHLVGEACALYSLGILFPEFREARRWRRHGREVLERVLADQFYADGGSAEQSTFYHHATTGFYLLAALLGRANGEELSDDVWRAVERALEFSAILQQPDGTTPRIGGADDGKPIRLEHLPFWDFRPYQAIGAVIFDRPDFKAAAGRFFEDALWLLGPDSDSRFAALDGGPALPIARVLDSSGYVVVRSGWSADADYLCFDCGEQAAGLRRDAIPSAAHGHADCLSTILWRRGQPVLVDAGFHCYNGPKPWQDHFRETASHTTIRIDGRDQALHINKMAWAYTYTPTLEGYGLDDHAWAVASHDGFSRLPSGGVTHRRAVWIRNGYVILCDLLDGRGTHDVEAVFQFAPGTLAIGDADATFGDLARMHWFAPVRLTPRVHEGQPAPDGGWIAPSLGVKTAAPRLVLSAKLQMPAVIVSLVVDLAPNESAAVPTLEGAEGALVVAGAGWTDVLTVRGLASGASQGLETDGLMAAWRASAGRLENDGHVGGTFQRCVNRA